MPMLKELTMTEDGDFHVREIGELPAPLATRITNLETSKSEDGTLWLRMNDVVALIRELIAS